MQKRLSHLKKGLMKPENVPRGIQNDQGDEGLPAMDRLNCASLPRKMKSENRYSVNQ